MTYDKRAVDGYRRDGQEVVSTAMIPPPVEAPPSPPPPVKGKCPTCGHTPAVRRRKGDVERALDADLKHHATLIGAGGRATLVAMARTAARLVDTREGAGPTTTAKLLQELKAITNLLFRKGEADGDDDDGEQVDPPDGSSVPSAIRN